MFVWRERKNGIDAHLSVSVACMQTQKIPNKSSTHGCVCVVSWPAIQILSVLTEHVNQFSDVVACRRITARQLPLFIINFFSFCISLTLEIHIYMRIIYKMHALIGRVHLQKFENVQSFIVRRANRTASAKSAWMLILRSVQLYLMRQFDTFNQIPSVALFSYEVCANRHDKMGIQGELTRQQN